MYHIPKSIKWQMVPSGMPTVPGGSEGYIDPMKYQWMSISSKGCHGLGDLGFSLSWADLFFPGITNSYKSIQNLFQQKTGKIPPLDPGAFSQAIADAYANGEISFEEYLQYMDSARKLQDAVNQHSGWFQAANILKWVALIGGAGLALYFLFPALKVGRSGFANLVSMRRKASV